MRISFDIPDDQVDNLSSSAKTTLEGEIKKYTDSVIKEANLIEQGFREDGASEEITSSTIIQAVRKSKIHKRKKSSKTMTILIKSAASVTAFIAGVLTDLDAMQKSSFRTILVLIFFALACFTGILQFVDEEKEN